MNLFALPPSMQVPRPDPVPMAGPSWLFTPLLLVTFFLHVLPMNLVLGGSIVATVAALKGRRLGRNSHQAELSRILARTLPVAIAFAITFGVAALLFAQVLYGRFLYTSSILMGWYWFSVIPILILAYYATYVSVFREGWWKWKGLAAILLAAILFLLVAFIYSNNMSLMLRPEIFRAKYSAHPNGLSLNVGDMTLFPRFLHMVTGALAVTGLFIAMTGMMIERRKKEFGAWAMRYGLVLFTGATSLNLIIGTWFLLSFSPENLLLFMRTQPWGVTALACGIIFGLVTLGCGVLALYSPRPEPLTKAVAGTLILTLLLMILLRDQLRRSILSPVSTLVTWEVPQWSAILTFLFLLVAAIAAIVWMLKKFFR